MSDPQESEVIQPPPYSETIAAESVIPNKFGPDTRSDFQVLKDGDLFALFAPTGDMNGREVAHGENLSKDGLFHCDTRYLSRFALTINGTDPIMMGEEAHDDTALYRCDLSNGRLIDDHGREIKPYDLHFCRQRFLSEGLYERLDITNFGLHEVHLDVVYDCWSDFRDVFEVRGAEAKGRGRLLPPSIEGNRLQFSYESRDGRLLSTEVRFDDAVVFYGIRPHLSVAIQPGGTQTLSTVVRINESEQEVTLNDGKRRPRGSVDLAKKPPSFDEAGQAVRHRLSSRIARTGKIETSNRAFNSWLARSASDLAMLSVELDTGLYPYAGVPWFSVPFGRDGIITALQTLWLDAGLAAGVLEFLAAVQATEVSDFRDSAPGKILHETRSGEMARLGEVPFERYYGGIDQTLLFVILAHAYHKRTGDRERLERLKGPIVAALDWARDSGDLDGDGFIEYERSHSGGLQNQGWKDSDDSIFHADGRLAEGTIALVEVQAYYVAALRAGADIFEVLGDSETGAPLSDQADALVESIDEVFWDDDLGTYCIALDGKKAKVRTVSSNAGHVFYAGAAKPERAETFAASLSNSGLLTGWGIRTVGAGAARFNPMGYHNGSIWPHDNSLIASGLARYGQTDAACRITQGLFDASCAFHEHRLPELWCGFKRTEKGDPVAYPSSCSPQAWAAATSFLCLEACLGVSIDAVAMTVNICRPALPDCLDTLTIRGLEVGGHSADLQFHRCPEEGVRTEILAAAPEIQFRFENRR